MIWLLHVIIGTGLFVIGTAVGSFLNVCIYRLPWQKSVIWPASRCMSCMQPIASFDNIPVLSWLALRGECRNCGSRISARYPFVELLVGLLFLAVYLVDVAAGASLMFAPPAMAFLRMGYHLVLVAFLVMATFIDYDLFIIPDEVTVTGMVAGLVLGALVPSIRPEPAFAATHGGGLVVGLLGLAVGGGIIWFFRIFGRLVFRREAMGFGDVTLMAMIGTFMGWQATILTLVLAAFLGLFQAVQKILFNLGKRIMGHKLRSADREIPFGPYLSLGALVLLLWWPWLWPAWGAAYFDGVHETIKFFMGA
ncbi:MAG TPA: prepilin peptidase [Isosphaeraceae bacterium]|jgi:leader peptidase (prepilin peptidase)/N-methyltransferase|nr:prepilin peptidase [Isosphaeraceae bacterium]